MRPGWRARRRDRGSEFEAQYLSEDHEQVFGSVEDDDLLIPNTLTLTEREIVVRLYRGFRQTEIADQLELGKREMERSMRLIRSKLADWRPTCDDALDSTLEEAA